ncbi:hypothetical protein JXL19_06995 [bacterium]|nr:hypothetical protein [bacterium]
MSKWKMSIKTTVLLAIFLCLISLCATESFPSSEPDPKRMEGINDLIQEIFYKSDQPRQRIDEYSHIKKCATPIIMYALKNKHLLRPENSFILYRPTDPRDQDYYGNVEVLYFDTTHFRVHYTEDNSNGDAVPGSDSNPNTVPYYIKNLASYLEYSWGKEIVTMGYSIINFDGLIGGGLNLIDVYVLNISYYGFTSIDKSNYPYIVIDKDLNGRSSSFDTDPNGILKVTAAHEFFHVIQYDYDDWENLWWEENTAAWMEDEVYDHVNDYVRYLPYKLSNLDLPLDEEPYHIDLFIYGGVIWAKYLSENYGQSIIRHIFERCAIINPPIAKEAIGYILGSYGSNWTDALAQFYIKNLTRDYQEAREGLNYPQVSLTQSVSATEIGNAFSSPLLTIDHLSCHYFKLQAGQEHQKLYVSLAKYGSYPSAVFLADRSNTGIPTKETVDSFFMDTNIALDGFGTSSAYPQAYLIVYNPHPENDNYPYIWAAAFEPISNPPPDPPPDPNQSVPEAFLKSDGGGCFISTL